MIRYRKLTENRFAGAWELHAEDWSRAQVADFDAHAAVLFHVLDERANGVTLILVLDAVTEAEAFTAARWLMEDMGDEVSLDWRWERAIGIALGASGRMGWIA